MTKIIIILAAALLGTAPLAHAATPKPILQLKLDNSVADTSGSTPAHNAVLQGGAQFDTNAPTAVSGDGSVLFNGTNAVVAVANPGDLAMAGGVSFSFAAWIRTDFTDSQRVIFARSTTNFAEGGQYKTAALYLESDAAAGSATLIYDVYYVGAVRSTTSVPLGQWTHVAMIYDSGTCHLYVNGSPAGQGGIGSINEGDNGEAPWEFTIGATRNPDFPGTRVGIPNGAFKGNIDDVQFWNVALADAEVLEVYQSVGPLITISQQPADTTVVNGAKATFTINASGSGVPAGTSLQYQWQTNAVNIAGATNASFTTAALSLADNGLNFRCLLSAPGALSATSREAVLTVVEPILPPAPLAWLSFNNTLNDQAGGAVQHQGTLVPSVTPQYATDVVNATAGAASLSLSGDGTYVNVAHPEDLNMFGGHAFTIAAWVKTTNMAVIVAKSTSSWTPGGDGTHTAALYIDDDGHVVYDVYWQGAVSSAAVVNNGQWTHVAVTSDGSTYRLYVNGSPSGSGGFGGVNEGANGEGPWNFTVGATLNIDFPKPAGVDGAPLQGLVDEVAFWSAELSPAQMLNVVNQGIPKIAISITQQPADALAHPGETVSFTVAATAVGTTAPLQYQWQRNGADITGATNSSYTTPPLTVADNGALFHCVISAGTVSATSRDAALTVPDTTSAYPKAVLDDKPLVYYRFEEVAGATVYDSTSNNHNGTAANLARVPSYSPALGTAANFNGTSASVAVPALPTSQGDTAYNQVTIEAWVNVQTFSNPEGFECLYNHDGWSSGSLHMHVNPGNLWEFSVNGSAPTDQYVGDATLLKTDTWYHFAAVYDSDAGTLARYINGQLVTNVTYDATVPIDLGAAHMGGWNGSARFFKGSIDEFALYPTALSADRIKAHYDAAVPTVGPSIAVSLSGTKVVMSWSGSGFVLQKNSGLSDAAGWTDTPGGDTSPVTVNVGTGNLFFRLKK